MPVLIHRLLFHHVPSLSKLAIRSAMGTRSGLLSFVKRPTKSMIIFSTRLRALFAEDVLQVLMTHGYKPAVVIETEELFP